MTFNETEVHKLLQDDPPLLGLGPLELLDRERGYGGSGRMDLLLCNTSHTTRYVVELQKGRLDEKHLVHLIEYWDIERQSSRTSYGSQVIPVIVAETFTARELHWISIFEDKFGLQGRKLVVSGRQDALEVSFGPVGVLEEVVSSQRRDAPLQPSKERMDWVKKTSEGRIRDIESCLALCQQTYGEKSYVKWDTRSFYVQIKAGSNGKGIVSCLLRTPHDRAMLVQGVSEAQQWKERLAEAGIEMAPEQDHQDWFSAGKLKPGNDKKISFRLNSGDVEVHRSLLRSLFASAGAGATKHE